MSAGPADSFVAVLERRGRFMVAEPLFGAASGAAERSGRRARAERVTLGSARASAGGRVRANPGDIVLVHSPRRGGPPRVLQRLGHPQVARDVIEALVLDRGLSRGFPAEVEQEARGAAARVARERTERRDLRALPTFTIDPASARDFDDAISAEALETDVPADGEPAVRVWVHIADVAAHVAEGSLIDREARRRATSVYAPGTVEPMLPHALSSEACSLLPGQERAAVTVELELRGTRLAGASFYRSLIRSDARLDYEQVDRIFAGHERAGAPWGPALAAARQVAAALERERRRAGALVIDSEEPEFSFDDAGGVVAVLPRPQTESHRLIEHLMIAANEGVARMLERRAVPCLYRVHERPEPRRIAWLVEQLASLEVPTPALPEHMSSTRAAELVGEISVRVDQHVHRTGRGRRAFGSLVLRSLMQAYYSPKNLGHAGLRSNAYCHFTSPIRRYPDLVCHRALLSAIGAGEHAPRAGELVELGVWSSEREREAMLIERDCDDVARCFALERLLRERDSERPFEGEVVGLIGAGAFIAFDAQQGAGDPSRRGGSGPTHGAETGALEGGAFEGMLPVRAMRAPPPTAQARRRERERVPARPGNPRAQRSRAGGRDRGDEGTGVRDWWELNEFETVLHAERSGATVRLGDAIRVRVHSVDAVRGRVELRGEN